MPEVRIRYWAAARDAAGVETDRFEAASVTEALALAQQAHPTPQMTRVLAVSSVLRDGRVVHREQRDLELAGPTELEVLPPFAGG